jgi:hypothetical protein
LRVTKRRQASSEQAWATAKTLCRLSAWQVEMAQALGMNPRTLPRLRPTAEQRWKLPVGAFIEVCYRKRFGAPSGDDLAARRPSHRPSAQSREQGRAAQEQAALLVSYLTNLSDDLARWLQHGTIPPGVLTEVRGELRDIVHALDTGASVPQLPAISVPPNGERAAPGRRGRGRPFGGGDDDPPF